MGIKYTEKNRQYKKAYNLRHPGLGLDRLKEQQAKNMEINRKYVFDFKATHPCCVCGESRHDCLVFHHIGNKDREVGKLLRNSPYMIIEEIAKCIVLCANCHTILHAEERRGKKINEWLTTQPGYSETYVEDKQMTLFEVN